MCTYSQVKCPFTSRVSVCQEDIVAKFTFFPALFFVKCSLSSFRSHLYEVYIDSVNQWKRLWPMYTWVRWKTLVLAARTLHPLAATHRLKCTRRRDIFSLCQCVHVCVCTSVRDEVRLHCLYVDVYVTLSLSLSLPPAAMVVSRYVKLLWHHLLHVALFVPCTFWCGH